MGRVTGIGGVFFKARDPERLRAWYQEHLGLVANADGSAVLRWRDDQAPGRMGSTVWAPMAQTTPYFDPSPAPFMINYRVVDLDGLLTALRAAGQPVDDQVEEYEYGRFAWVMDPEGNRVELWEPAGEE